MNNTVNTVQQTNQLRQIEDLSSASNRNDQETFFVSGVGMYDNTPDKKQLSSKKCIKKFLKSIDVHKIQTTEMKNSPHSQSFRLNCTIFGESCKALIDTGAEASLVNIDYLMKVVKNSKIEPSVLHYSHYDNATIKAANGKQISVLGEVTLPILRENIGAVNSRFIIARCGLPKDILIG